MTASTWTVEAPAKINLFLRVLARRPDGFHELETLFQAVSLSDVVTLTLDPAGPDSVELDVHGAELGPVEENLAWLAAESFREATGVGGAVRIDLVKRIPAGAGLGGGSSDAAAVLRLLARAGSRDDPGLLHDLGVRLGSDVPFFLGDSPLALGRGRGEALAPLPPLPEASLVLALPPVHVATGEAYGTLAGWRASGRAPSAKGPRPDADLRVTGWDAVAGLAHNDFEAMVAGSRPDIAASLARLREAGAAFALLSGSGGASCGIFGDRRLAEEAVAGLTARCGWPFLHVRTLTKLPVPTIRPRAPEALS